jgi:hypothetical protein
MSQKIHIIKFSILLTCYHTPAPYLYLYSLRCVSQLYALKFKNKNKNDIFNFFIGPFLIIHCPHSTRLTCGLTVTQNGGR